MTLFFLGLIYLVTLCALLHYNARHWDEQQRAAEELREALRSLGGAILKEVERIWRR